jgi:gamma-butyrobetaine dioxygenase
VQSLNTLPLLKLDAAAGLVAELPDGVAVPVHPIWLRERSEAPEAMDAGTGQRLHDPSDLPLDLAVVHVAELEGGRFEVRFSDDHATVYDGAALAREIALPPGDHDLPPVRAWTGELVDLPRFVWDEAPDDATRLAWVSAFLEYGFVVFSGVPSTDRSVIRVGEAFGHVRVTNFGDLFDVRSVPNANDLAYTALELGAHTDNPYRTPVPGVQLLHCLVNETSGGLSTLVDGLAVAGALRERDPEAFEVLTTTPVRFRFRDRETELVASAPPIELDVTGAIRGIHMSPRLDYVPLMAPDRLGAYYRARKLFDHMLRDPAFEIRFLLDDGDLVMFDNVRLLHGRTSFDPAEGLRHLQGCYIDVDGPRSLYRVLRRGHAA